MTIAELRKAIKADPSCRTIGKTHYVPMDMVKYWLGWAEAYGAQPTSVEAFMKWCLVMEETVGGSVPDFMPDDWRTDSEGGES